MDATEFRRLQPMLARYLQDFSDCFTNKRTRAHLKTYVYGQLSDLERKSVEPMADAASVPVRTLQEYLSQLRWEEDLLRVRLQQRVAQTRPSDTRWLDRRDQLSQEGQEDAGRSSPVLREHRQAGQRIVTVHLGYAVETSLPFGRRTVLAGECGRRTASDAPQPAFRRHDVTVRRPRSLWSCTTAPSAMEFVLLG
jgi:hypothetical protein